MKISHVLLIAVIGVILLTASSPVLAENASALYQEGLMKETGEGDLDAAIELYREIVSKHADTTEVAARAQLRIGMCYEKLGREQATEAYQKVIERFPGEAEIVQQARERLQALAEAGKVNRPEVGAGPEKTKAVIAELDRKRERVQSYRSVLSTSMEMMGNSVTTTGKMLFRRPDLMRMETSGAIPAQFSINIFDGKINWTYQPQMNMAMKVEIERIRSEFPDFNVNNSLFESFQGLEKGRVQYIRNTTFADEEVAVFQGYMDDKMAQMGLGSIQPAWVEVWVGMEDGLLRRMVMYRESGEEMMIIEVEMEEINPSIPDSTFVFNPPKGAKVMDMTEGTLNMMRQARTKEPEGEESEEASSEAVEAVIKEIGEKREAAQSYRSRVTQKMQMMGTMMNIETEEWSSGKKSRREMTNSMMPTGKTIAVGDEQVLWTYMPSMKMVQKMDMQRVKEAKEEMEKAESEEEPGSFHGMERETIQYLGRDVLEGEEVHVFKGESAKIPQELKRLQLKRVEIWIGVEDGLVRKKLGYNSEDKEVMTEIRTDVEINPSLPDSLFIFTPPEGVQVMDITDSAIDMAQKMKASKK
jgi:outer membrane lipoprotein-sorting protein